jgi:multiple sugar transport system ATP-binding protein
MNLLSGIVQEDGSLGLDGALRLALPRRLPAGARVTLGVRPEHLHPAREGQAPAFTARVVSVEPTGADTHIVCELHGAVLTLSLRERARPAPGDTLQLAMNTNHLHYFDSDSGATLAPA